MALRLRFWREGERSIHVMHRYSRVLLNGGLKILLLLDGLLLLCLVLLLVDLGICDEGLRHLIALLVRLVGVILHHCHFSVLFLLSLQPAFTH